MLSKWEGTPICDLGLVLGAASTLVGAVGAKQQANAQADAAEYNAKVNDMNATLAERRARDALERGRQDEQQKRNETAQIEGRQRAAMAANGVDLSFGSPLDTLVSTATLGEVDALTVRRNAANEAYDNQVQAENSRAVATLNRMNAKASRTAGNLNAFSTILTGAGKAYSSGASLGYWGKT